MRSKSLLLAGLAMAGMTTIASGAKEITNMAEAMKATSYRPTVFRNGHGGKSWRKPKRFKQNRRKELARRKP